MTVTAIQQFLHDPDEIEVDEYRIIHKRILELIRDQADPQQALKIVLETCDTFIDWAEATKMVLEPLIEELAGDG